jgi:hypothetical protein
MQKPPLDPDVADTAPSDSVLKSTIRSTFVTYLRLLDAHAEGADWREVARVVLHLDPELGPAARSRQSFAGWGMLSKLTAKASGLPACDLASVCDWSGWRACAANAGINGEGDDHHDPRGNRQRRAVQVHAALISPMA